ncbi:hypothetical protein ABE493_01375 [Stenotrophomonas terrae]|uniref:hypothetical protein n=1 Tax=Stenotrophomonas terrae TaxID=405446 RepID=UPI00320B6B6E
MNWIKLKRLGAWFLEIWVVWTTLLVLFAGGLTMAVFGWSEPSIRLSGLAMQVLGIATVIYGLHSTRRHFGHRSPMESFGQWVRRCPLVRRRAYLEPEGVTISCAVVGMRLTTHHVPKATQDVSEKMAHLESGILLLQDRIGGAESQIDTHASEFDGRIKAEASARTAGDDASLKALEESSTGGIHISAMGTVLLLVGVVLSTAGIEISGFLAT